MFLADPHISIDSTTEQVNGVGKEIAKRGFRIGSVVAPFGVSRAVALQRATPPSATVSWKMVEKACRNCAAGHVEPKAARAPSGKRAGSPRRPGAASCRLPDVSAATHEQFRTKFDELVALVVERNIGTLKSYKISPISSSPKALNKYRNLAVIALTGSAPAEFRRFARTRLCSLARDLPHRRGGVTSSLEQSPVFGPVFLQVDDTDSVPAKGDRRFSDLKLKSA